MHFNLGQLSIDNRIAKTKILFLKHFSSLEDGALAKLSYEKQKKFIVPSLISECSEDLIKMGVTLKEMEDMSKKQWKNTVSDYFKDKNEEELVRNIKLSHKLDYEVMSKEKC